MKVLSPTEALRAATEAALVWRAVDRAAIVVSGKDRATWLNGLVTCELARLAEREATYGLLVEKKGRIQTDLYVVPGVGDHAGALALAVPLAIRDAVQATLDHYLIMEDAELTAPNLTFFLLVGPRAAEIAEKVSHLASFAGSLPLLGGAGAVVAAAAGDALEVALASAGGALATDDAWDALRISRGVPRFGVEIDTSQYPQEAALEKSAVSFSKGCYLGQEVVYMLENRGHVKQKLVPLDVEGEGPLPRGAAVTTAGGEGVGEVRSAVASLVRSGETAAIAMVKYAQSKPGTDLLVEGRKAQVRA